MKPTAKTQFLLHLSASHETFSRAKKLRASMTKAEKILWETLRNCNLEGYKFRRQHPLKWFIADFYCHEARLIIEVDGRIHLDPVIKEHDKNRSLELQEAGLKVIRFTNDEVINQLEVVLETIKTNLKVVKRLDEKENELH